MASRFTKLAVIAAVAALGAGGYLAYMARAAQAQGELAQAPLNVQSSVTPAFIMAIDDSGSMTYHNQFPGADGKACWSQDTTSDPWSFFITSGPNAGQLRTTSGGSTTCAAMYAFSYGRSPRNGESNNWRGIPPVDTNGFARSPDFNPAYFDPNVTYEPWVDSENESFGNADPAAARIDPRPLGAGLGTVDLTASITNTNSASSSGQLSDRFNPSIGMVLPAGTRYYLSNNCGGLSGGEWNTLASDYTVTAHCQVYIEHRLATFYLRGNDIPPGYESVARTEARDACGPGCNMWRYDIESHDTEALQNFANWFSYYGNRHRALVAGLTLSFANVNKLRAGYFRISQHGSFDNPNLTTSSTSNSERLHMRDMADQDDKDSLYDLIMANPAWSSTFNRQSVYAAGQQFRRRDPLGSQRGGAPVQLACQKNAIMLFTDGYSNGGTIAVGNLDEGMGVPFADDFDDTLADIATRFYLNDSDGNSPIRPDITPAGMAPIDDGCPSSDPKRNCQANLHVNFYGVTLNGRGDLYDPVDLRDPYTDPAVYNNWPNWQNDNRSTIDDIWHATVNTRGRLINARTPADIRGAIRDILSSLTAGGASSGTSSVTGARISERSLAIAPGYGAANSGTSWYGTLRAFKPEVNLTTLAVSETEIWRAEDELLSTSAATRRNHTWFGNTTGGVSRFNETNIIDLQRLCNNPRPGMSRCSQSELASLGLDVGGAIDYLLGDTSREVRNGGTLRDRLDEFGDANVLGDIVNSTPVISAPTDDYGYRNLGTHGVVNYGATYNTYMTTKESRHAMVYVGANDGMLHGFHGGIDHEGSPDPAGGSQMFSYIPRAVLGHTGNLLFPYDPDAVGQKFDHRYFVDGPIVVGDAHFGGGWKTALVGTTGAGGRSVFAFDVSNPSSFTSSNNRLWEIDDQHADITVRENIGHVLGKPVIVPFREPVTGAVSWKAIFGNGYNSVRNRAVLFVVDLGSGDIRMIEAEESGAPAGRNGIGNIVVVDRYDSSTSPRLAFRDGFADTVYAADRKGAIWRFDLLDSASSISTPLFTTREHSEGGTTYRQPILGGLIATAGRGGGVMLMFGTGSFSFDGDAGDESIQSIYGIEDNGAAATITRAGLFARTIGENDANVRTITPGGMSYGYAGWYIDLPAGERVVSYPRVASGVLFIPTYAPTEADGCSTGGENWLFGLDTRTGAPALSSVRGDGIDGETLGDAHGSNVGAVALQTGGSSPVRDVGVQVVSTSRPIVPASGGDPLPRCWLRVTVPGMSNAMNVPYPCGRQSWRQLQ